MTQYNETLFPNWQKESWQTFEETSRYVRPERVNKWPNSMTDMMMMMIIKTGSSQRGHDAKWIDTNVLTFRSSLLLG